MYKLKNDLHRAYRKVATKFKGDMTESQFLEAGKLTPEEFVFAGDSLIEYCPTWQWEAGDPSKTNSNLPEDKQFLVTRGVPCMQRAKDLATDAAIEETEDEDGWVVAETKGGSAVADIDGEEEKKEVPEEEEVADIDDSSEEEEENIFAGGKKESEVLKCRRYDISITYDEYYNTPRLWLTGYDEEKNVIGKEIFEDVMAEHAKKTVTLEAHHHATGPDQATIHPCEHASVMKKMLDLMV